MIVDVTDLLVYRNALKLTRPVYRLANLVPKSPYKLRVQIINSAESIAPLIAEGYGKKKSAKEFKRYLEMAMGSSDETITHLRQIKILSETFKNIKPETCDALIERYKILSKQLQNLIKTWQTF